MATKTPAQQKAYEDQIMAEWNKAKAKETAASTANPALVQQNQQAAEAFKQANWQNGGTTVTPTTGAQNLNAVIGQAGNTVGQSANIQGIQAQAAKDTQAQSGGGGGTPTPVYTPPTGNVDTTPMKQALQSYIPPAATGLNFDQATSQVRGQIDPMFARALEALQAQKYQDQLNGDQLGMARGGAHSGLAADLQNKVSIAAAGKASDLDATRQTQIAQMAQDLVNRGQDNDFRNKQQALAEYLGLNQLDLQKTGQIADYTGQYGGQQTLAAQNQGFNQNLATNQYNQGVKNDTFNQNMASKQFDYQKVQDDIKNGQWTTQTENQMKQWAEGNKLDWAQFNQQTKQALAQIAISQQNANTSSASQANSANNSSQNQLMDIWKATGKAPAGISGVTAGTPYAGQTAPKPDTFNLDDFKGYINQNFYKDVPADPSKPWENKTIKKLDETATRKYIISQGLDDSQTDQLLKLYKLPTN